MVSDLIFATRIRHAAAAEATEVRFVSSASDLSATESRQYDLTVVDLNFEGADPIAWIRELRARGTAGQIVAYVSHVQTDLASSAVTAGADRVLPRSRFVAELADLLRGQR